MSGPPGAAFIREIQKLLGAGQSARALELLRAKEPGNTDPEVPLHIALALRMQGDLAGALAAIDAALALEPYHFLALLSKGAIVEMMGHRKAAARIYRDALKISPAEKNLPPSLKAPVERARKAVDTNADALARHLRAAVAPVRAQFKGARLDRFDESLDILAGLKKPFVHEPLLLAYPKLPALTFFDREYFPWLAELEAATEVIRDEAFALLKDDAEKFRPYIQFPAGAPVNQWAKLNHSPSWSTLFLWRDGRRVDDACRRSPKTTALLDKLPLARQDGFAPTAMFSALAARATIPPHTGSTNTRLIVHLPLILPARCRFRVGNDVREWRVGEAWVFDDTIEHEAWNDSDEVRVILIFDVWNPLLSEAERTLVTAMMTALKAYNAE